MKIRTFLVGAIACAALTSTSLLQAQEKKGRGMPSPEQQVERIEQAVGSLSADQKTKIQAVYAKLAEKMQALPQEERREKGMELFQAARKDVRALLTAEQQKKFDDMSPGGGGGKSSGKGGGKKKNN